jgi:hypothetical protein
MFVITIALTRMAWRRRGVSDLEQELTGWFVGRTPDAWFVELPEISFDREEILVIGRLSEPKLPADASAELRAAAYTSRIEDFREESRDRRARIANEAEALYGRKVSWGALCGERRKLFTTVSVPVMTRLRLNERKTLDTLIDAGVARCVRLVGQRQAEWLAELRDALTRVEQVRATGPDPSGDER